MRSALNVLETSPSFLGESEGGSEVAGGGVGGGLKAILSLDMNVLPSSTQEDMFKLIDIVIECMRSGRYMTTQFPRTREMMGVVDGKGEAGMRGRPILSTFGGHECSFGGKGWTGFLEVLKEKGFDVSRPECPVVPYVVTDLVCPTDDFVVYDESGLLHPFILLTSRSSTRKPTRQRSVQLERCLVSQSSRWS